MSFRIIVWRVSWTYGKSYILATYTGRLNQLRVTHRSGLLAVSTVRVASPTIAGLSGVVQEYLCCRLSYLLSCIMFVFVSRQQNKDFDVTLLEGGKSVGGLVAGWLTPGGRPVEAGVHGFW